MPRLLAVKDRLPAIIMWRPRVWECHLYRFVQWVALPYTGPDRADPRRQRSARLARQHSERIGTSISVTLPNRASSAERSLAFAAARSASLAVMIPL